MPNKQKGKHPHRALSAVGINKLKHPGRYADGNGLHLVVDKSLAKRWMLRISVRGRRRDFGLGGVQTVSLAEARDLADQYLKVAKSGGDPLSVKQSQKPVLSFADAAAKVHAEHCASWKNAKHAAQWISSLRVYACPHIGNRPIDAIDSPDILKVLAPIWLTKPETARRVKQRMGTVFDWAKTAGHRNGENPVVGVATGLPKQAETTSHHAALPYSDVPAFAQKLRSCSRGASARLAFEFLILTATRTNEPLEPFLMLQTLLLRHPGAAYLCPSEQIFPAVPGGSRFQTWSS